MSLNSELERDMYNWLSQTAQYKLLQHTSVNRSSPMYGKGSGEKGWSEERTQQAMSASLEAGSSFLFNIPLLLTSFLPYLWTLLAFNAKNLICADHSPE